MDDQVQGPIEALVSEEHSLWEREAGGAATDAVGNGSIR